jgi:predicted MFS family arabinose efflux permease
MAIVYALGGLGVSMIFPMVTALIGQHIPKEGRTNAIAFLMAGNSLLYLVGMPLVNYLGNWRQSFLFFSIPLLLLSIILSFIFIPKEEITHPSQDVLAGYKGVFSSRSAVACLLAQALGSGAWMITLTLAFSFFREVFLMPRGNVVYLTFGTASTYMLGALSSRRIIPNLGLKRSTMFTLALIGLFSLVYLSGVNYVVSLVFVLVVAMLGGVNQTSTQGLSLEQLPELRGSMMSLFAASSSVGSVVSLSLGGFVLIWFGWGALGTLSVILCVLGYFVLSFYVIEPKIK